MFYTKLKPIDKILPLVHGKTVIIRCIGCREISRLDEDVKVMLSELTVARPDIKVVEVPNACQPEIVRLHAEGLAAADDAVNTLLVISCGVGVQTVSDVFRQITAYTVYGTDNGVNTISCCDTFPLPGFQGLTPAVYSCALCGECHLNDTGGICPVTSCSKSLLNGECGGAKDGMCEVDPSLPCGWERIYSRISTCLSLL